MKSPHSFTTLLLFMVIVSSTMLSSCDKEELVGFKGTVVNPKGEPVVKAQIQLFNSPEDWLTGLNVVAVASSDLVGEFEFTTLLNTGEYYIFIEKYDSSNWEIRQVEQGIYPTITLPDESGSTHTIDYNNMSLMASTNWELTNVHREYTKPGETVVQWQSIWASINNCRRDNYITFGKDLSMRISEGNSICRGTDRNILGSFVPPLIFNSSSCTNLPNTTQDVKEFEFEGWAYMKAHEAKMYLACSQSVGQMYVYYKGDDGMMMLDVYSRR